MEPYGWVLCVPGGLHGQRKRPGSDSGCGFADADLLRDVVIAEIAKSLGKDQVPGHFDDSLSGVLFFCRHN